MYLVMAFEEVTGVLPADDLELPRIATGDDQFRFPKNDRNHTTAADRNADATLQKATQTIHHGNAHPSRIILPRVPGK